MRSWWAPVSGEASPPSAWPKRATGWWCLKRAEGTGPRTSRRRTGTSERASGTPASAFTDLGPHPSSPCLRAPRRGRGRRQPQLLQQPPRAPGRRVPKVRVGTGPVEGDPDRPLRRGTPHARGRRQPLGGIGRPDPSGNRHGDPGRGHLPHQRRGRVLRRARQDRARPLFRGAGTGADRLHLLRGLHDRVPGRRQEHPGQELPLPGRGPGGNGPCRDRGHGHSSGRRRL